MTDLITYQAPINVNEGNLFCTFDQRGPIIREILNNLQVSGQSLLSIKIRSPTLISLTARARRTREEILADDDIEEPERPKVCRPVNQKHIGRINLRKPSYVLLKRIQTVTLC